MSTFPQKIIITLLFLVFLTYWHVTVQRPAPIYVSPINQISETKNSQFNNKAYEIIKFINDQNSKIDSIYVKNMKIKLQQKNLIFNVSGELAMKKAKNFRLKINHPIFGEEMDIGSNEQYFWFWSKHMKPSALHYAKHKDTNKTMLKTALNPEWMIESLNINPISIENIKITQFKEFIAIIQERVATTGENVTVLILIDPKSQIVMGRYLYNQNEKLIASAEYKPNKILIIWYEEAIVLKWDLSNIKINSGIDKKMWSMPEFKNKINIGN